MRRIMVFTFTRAEYGLLKPVLRKIEASPALEMVLVVAGDHFNAHKGRTIEEIESDGFRISAVIDHFTHTGDREDTIEALALTTKRIGELLSEYQPQLIVLLGDRYELLTAATCAVVCRVPVAHIAGGESTEGVLDEQVRHAITKISHLHFPATRRYGWNTRLLGEEAWRIHVVGSPGVENITRGDYMSADELQAAFGIDARLPTMLITFHPETLVMDSPARQMNELVAALRCFADYQQIITHPGAESGSQAIIDVWRDYAAANSNVVVHPSLGSRGYLGVMKTAKAVVGNSSSGIIEAPSLRVPTINIGARQKGRVRADSVIDVEARAPEIMAALRRALNDPAFLRSLKEVVNPYDPYQDGNVGGRIVAALEIVPLDQRLMEKRLDFPGSAEEEKYFGREGFSNC